MRLYLIIAIPKHLSYYKDGKLKLMKQNFPIRLKLLADNCRLASGVLILSVACKKNDNIPTKFVFIL